MATLNWAGTTTATASTAANWIDQATGLPPATIGVTDDVRFGTGTGATNNACTLDSAFTCRSLLVNGYTGTITHTANTLTIGDSTTGLGNVALSFVTTGWTYTLSNTSSSVFNFANTSGTQQTINYNGKSAGGVTINAPGGSYVATTAINRSGGAMTVTLTAGTLDLTGLNCTWGRFSMNNSNTKALNITNATISLANNGSVWNAGSATPANTTFTITGGTINMTEVSVTARTFAGGTLTYPTVNYTVAGATGALTMTGAATYGSFNFSDSSNARTISFTNNTTYKFNSLNINGTSGKLMTVNNVTGSGTTAALQKTGTGIWSMDFLTVTDIKANDAYTFYAGANSTTTGTTINVLATVPDTIQRRQTAANTGTATSITGTYGSATVSGNLLVAAWSVTATPGTITSPSGWTQALTSTNSATTRIYYKIADGTETTVTVSQVNSVNTDIFIWEITGFAGTPTLDVTDSHTSSGAVTTLSTAGTSPSNTTTTAYAFGVFGLDGALTTPTATNSYELEYTTGNTRLQPTVKPLSAIAAQSTTLSWSTIRTGNALLTVFKDVVIAAANTGATLMMMGV